MSCLGPIQDNKIIGYKVQMLQVQRSICKLVGMSKLSNQTELNAIQTIIMDIANNIWCVLQVSRPNTIVTS